jgi:hypothetical protein
MENRHDIHGLDVLKGEGRMDLVVQNDCTTIGTL